MTAETREIFREDATAREVDARILRVDDNRLVVDATVFYPAGGGQPGDRGTIETADGRSLTVEDTVYGPDRGSILHVVSGGTPLPAAGETVRLRLDWPRREALMRMHTALHLLTAICPYPVTGAALGEEESRIDFDSGEAELDKAEITRALAALVAADHPVTTRWITDAELDAEPGLVKSANVRPPRGTGRVRLVVIGADGGVDSQPCGGTHVRSTGEIGAVHVGKIEKKGRANRRLRVRFGPLPE